MQKPGFEVKTLGGTPYAVSFYCPECTSYDSFVFRSHIDENGNHKNFSKTCCQQYFVSKEVLYAMDAAEESVRHCQTQQKLDETKSNLAVYIMFGVVPLVMGIIFQSHEAIYTGMATTVIALIIWYYSKRP